MNTADYTHEKTTVVTGYPNTRSGFGTPTVRWITKRDGKTIGTSNTLKAAKELAAMDGES